MTLIDQGVTETLAMGAWVLPWALTGALLLITGRIVHSWAQPARGQILTLVAVPVTVSVTGVIIHMIRAGMAVMAGYKLAPGRRAPGTYDHVVAWLTRTTPWILVPQIVIGVAFALAVSSYANST